MVDLRAEEGTSARALELAILTAARSGEVRGAKPAEFDLEAAEWTVPGERMKAGKPHRVPLPPQAVALVRERIKAGDGAEYVFPGSVEGEPLSDMALLAALRRMDRGASQSTASGPRSRIGPRRPPVTQTSSPRWRWLTRSAMTWKPPTVAAISSTSGAG
jgi:integrase